MDEGEAGAVSSSGAAGETDFQNASASREAEQQKQAQDLLQQQQPQQAQQLMTPIQGARNYGYPDDFMMYGFKVGLYYLYSDALLRGALASSNAFQLGGLDLMNSQE
jgi:guanyl-specific ribonuclease Sa